MTEKKETMGMIPGMPGPSQTVQAAQCQGMPNQPGFQNGCALSKAALMNRIYETGFAMDDASLFLDTHPDCQDAFRYYQNAAAMKKNAVELYEAQYGPLMVEDVTTVPWSWITEKWPWEGGC